MISEQLREGTLLNERYRILKVLGQGGMGTVYLAEHTRLDTHVAVKEVCGVLSNTAELREALTNSEQEGRLLVRLHHPNLPQVTDAFVENDRFYLVMEYIEGETLEAKLRMQNGQPLDLVSVVNWGVQIASVLKYLHSQNPPIIFRDLKPANIMVTSDGTLRLIDFGIARRFQKGAKADTDPLGSVGYSPPEQFGDRQTDSRSDIYAFGATLHQLLTGRHPSWRPFKFLPARNINPAVPANLSALLNRCVAEDPKKRPASMEEVVRVLDTVRATLPASIHDVQTGSLSTFQLYEALSRGKQLG
jgi:serine/threonine-protein kinase